MGILDSPAKRAALLVFTISSFLTPFMASAIGMALPEIGREFAIDAVYLSWMMTAFLLSAAVFLVPFGRLADIHGRKRVFVLGIAIFTVFSLWCGASGSAAMLVVGRALQGIGSAMIFGTGIAILTSVFPDRERGRVLGINVAAVYAGLAAGPFLGGILVQHLGWRSVFYVNVPAGGLIILVVLRRLKGEWAESRGERFDLPGAVLYGAALVAIMLGFSELTGGRGVWLLAAGIAGLVLFVRRELRTASPVFDLRLFRHNPAFTFSNLAALINYAATYAVSFMLSLFLQYTRGYGADGAGVILVWQPIVMVLTSLYAGRLSDRVEPRIVASVGMGLVTVGLALLAGLGRDTGIPYLIASLVILGLGFGLFSSPNMNAVMGSVERRHYGVASGTVGTMRLLGQMFSMGIVTLIIAVHVGRVPITPANHDQFIAGLRTAFLVFAALCGAGIFASLARGRMRPAASAP
ncbi:MAG: MFS transporter [Candidatus Latescibacteria bacterium]|nr:MFS transporter [Candidatus Latescibacterota bacterium]